MSDLSEAWVLASRSPRREALLRALGWRFRVQPSGVDEEQFKSGTPRSVAMKTALAKAEGVAEVLPRGTRVLAADTIVVAPDGSVFTKPGNRSDACRMLLALSGAEHHVITGLCIMRAGGESLVDATRAAVRFHPLGDELIGAYVASGEAGDKAGAYGIQGLGSQFVEAVDGDVTGVIGLPLKRLLAMCAELGMDDAESKLKAKDGAALRAIALDAFPELARLPDACLAGLADSSQNL